MSGHGVPVAEHDHDARADATQLLRDREQHSLDPRLEYPDLTREQRSLDGLMRRNRGLTDASGDV